MRRFSWWVLVLSVAQVGTLALGCRKPTPTPPAPPSDEAVSALDGDPLDMRARVFALFVGIDAYTEKRALTGCARAAEQGAEALRQQARQSDVRVLTDDRATVAGVVSAVRDRVAKVGPSDSLLIFYCGHGERTDAAYGRRPSGSPGLPEYDGVDEALVLFDGLLLDDRLARELQALKGRLIAVLDACYSGGFADDLIAKPGRLGLFSSDKDLPAQLATDTRGAGYLARFFVDALRRPRGSEERPDAVTPGDLVEYLYGRYATSYPAMKAQFPEREAPRLEVRRSLSRDEKLFDVNVQEPAMHAWPGVPADEAGEAHDGGAPSLPAVPR